MTTFKKLSLPALVLASLAFMSTPALAARGHVPGKSFASKGSGPGQLEEPTGVAVNEATGDVMSRTRSSTVCRGSVRLGPSKVK
jgi:hypothetical protein